MFYVKYSMLIHFKVLNTVSVSLPLHSNSEFENILYLYLNLTFSAFSILPTSHTKGHSTGTEFLRCRGIPLAKYNSRL